MSEMVSLRMFGITMTHKFDSMIFHVEQRAHGLLGKLMKVVLKPARLQDLSARRRICIFIIHSSTALKSSATFSQRWFQIFHFLKADASKMDSPQVRMPQCLSKREKYVESQQVIEV